ncbi:hypothetical protein BH11PLA2_BH11PLA2_09560 [soil metagenome]
MTKYILDSGIVSLILDEAEPVYSHYRDLKTDGHRIGIGTPVLGELLAGLQHSQSKQKNLTKLRMMLKTLTIWSYNESAAEEYAKIKAHLRSIGRKIQEVDLQTAAISRTLRNCTVVTMDSDFAAIPGLNIENWMTP